MAIGERIRFFRILRGMTQQALGLLLGLPQHTAGTRIAQYETGSRKPKADRVSALAQALNVSPQALDLPNTESCDGVLHTLFLLEDLYGLRIRKGEGTLSFQVDKTASIAAAQLLPLLNVWACQQSRLEAGTLTKEEYDAWRYNFSIHHENV